MMHPDADPRTWGFLPDPDLRGKCPKCGSDAWAVSVTCFACHACGHTAAPPRLEAPAGTGRQAGRKGAGAKRRKAA